MKSTPKLMLTLFTIPLVAACGGGGGSTTATPPTFTEMEASKIALEVLYDADTARTDVPSGLTAPTATYEGYVGGALVGDGRDLIGELELTADFASTTVTGSADTFADSNEQAFTGTLTFSGAVMFGGDNLTPDTLEGSLTGDLDGDGKTYDTSILLDGSEFYRGASSEAPAAIEGTATGLLDDGGAGLLFDGTFIADRP